MTQETSIGNPYVGPRTFSYEQRHLFFGREREGRDLLARVLSERLLLFYAQTGAGKSSLLHTSLMPQLREEKGFVVLPVGRVSGDLPAGVDQVDNIFAFNLMLSIDVGPDPARLAHVTLSDFLTRLAHRPVVDGEGQAHEGWVYEGWAPPPTTPSARRYALIIDQFEEIIIAHPGRWQEREAFFRQLDQAMQADPNLWVVLTLREDYVAGLDPYAPLLADRLRARFRMERMGKDAALDAIRRPAELGGRPFASGVAEKLVDDLRQVRVLGQEETVPGQYVEPVQLQVVCYQLWERLEQGAGTQGRKGADAYGAEVQESRSATAQGRREQVITEADLAEAGDVNQALERFYAETLAAVLVEKAVQEAGVRERALRTWFDRELITSTGIRDAVLRNEATGQTGGMPNVAVDALGRRFLVRAEARGGDIWIELVHDRFVEPIRASNAAWFPEHLSALQRQAALWNDQGRSSGLLLRDEALAEAEAWAAGHPDELTSTDEAFLVSCREAQAAVVRERRQSRRIRMLAVAAIIISILAIGAATLAWDQTRQSRENAKLAEDRIAQVGQLVGDLGMERLLSLASELDKGGDFNGAVTLLQTAVDLNPALLADLDGGSLDADSYRLLATVSWWDSNGGTYTFIPPGTFTMGSDASDGLARDDEKPAQVLDLPGYWIGNTEVTNEQYGRCVAANVCEPPDNDQWNKANLAERPVTHVDLQQAVTYADWIGGRLPTEAEWEKACRGPDGRIYPWGDETPSKDRANYDTNGTTDVGSYPGGAHGLYDMAGNVWEWTSSQYEEYPYRADDGREDASRTNTERVWRGGSWLDFEYDVGCAARLGISPGVRRSYIGFRVVASPLRP